MTLAIAILPKNSKAMLYLLFISQYKVFNQQYITNKTERFSLMGMPCRLQSLLAAITKTRTGLGLD